MMIDISKPIYAKDKNTGKVHSVTAIYFPLGSLSGKDITVDVGENEYEWRSVDEVELIQYPRVK